MHNYAPKAALTTLSLFPNRAMGFYLSLVFLLSGLFLSNIALASDNKRAIHSYILQEVRHINVYLPENYNPKKKDGYSVIYMLDGGNDDKLTAKIADDYYKSGLMPEVIIIGIKNIRRGYDFTPPYLRVDRMPPQTYGNGEKFLKFIKNELIPYINEKYNSNDHKLFMGHSWGGLFAAYVLSREPALFAGFFLFSPALGFNTTQLFHDLKVTFKKDIKFPPFIYVSVGTKERVGFINSFDELIPILKEINPDGTILYHEKIFGANHSKNPELSIPKALRYYFK